MKRILFLLLLLCAWPAAAALLPEIQTDPYLVSTDQKCQAKAYREAAEFSSWVKS